MNYNLLINNGEETIAVMQDVNLNDLIAFEEKLELILKEHYCVSYAELACDIPEWISSRSQPEFRLEFEAWDIDGDHYNGDLNFSCVAIY